MLQPTGGKCGGPAGLRLPEGTRLVAVVRNGRSELTEESTVLRPGDIAAWPRGVRNGHTVQNRSEADCSLICVSAGDAENDWGEYPDIDLRFAPEGYQHKDGTFGPLARPTDPGDSRPLGVPAVTSSFPLGRRRPGISAPAGRS